MTAKIVTDKGLGPQIGSMILDAVDVGIGVTFSNLDNSGVSGWRWEIIDAPPESPTLYPLPAPVFTNTTTYANDVKGHSVLVRLTTYQDAARTILDDVDQVVLGVRFDPPFDWLIPAAGQTIEANMIRGWASDVNRMLKETHDFVEAGASSSDHKRSVRFLADSTLIPAYTAFGNVITASANGAFPATDGVTPALGDSFLLRFHPSGLSADAGIYVITQLGDGGTPWVAERRDDCNADALVTSGMRTTVTEGTIYHGMEFRLDTVDPIVVNTTPLNFARQTDGFFSPLWDHSYDWGEYPNSVFVNSTSFTANIGRINLWGGGFAGIVATLPTVTPEMHNRVIALQENNGDTAESLTITADPANYIYEDVAGVPLAGNSIQVQGARSLIVLQCDVGASGWKIVNHKLLISGLPNVAPATGDYLLFEDVSDANRKKRTTVNDILALGSSTDPNAIHDNVAGEIAAVASVILNPLDYLLIERAFAGNVKGRISANEFIIRTEYNAQTIMAAVADDLPQPITVGDGEFVGRPIGGNVGVVNAAQARAMAGVLLSSTAGEIAALASVAAAGADHVLVEDASDANNKKRVTVASIVASTAPASHVHDAADITTGTMDDARIAQSNVTQHEAALTILGSQVSDVVHTNVAGEIAALALVPVSASDHLLIEDASDANNKKRIAASDLMGSGTDPDAFHDNVAGEITALASKSAPAIADVFVIEDSAAADVKKQMRYDDLAGAILSAILTDINGDVLSDINGNVMYSL